MLLSLLFALNGGEDNSPAQMGVRKGNGGAETELRSHQRPSAASRSARPQVSHPDDRLAVLTRCVCSLGRLRTHRHHGIVGIIPPHRVEDARDTTRQRHRGDTFAPPLSDLLRPRLESRESGIR